MKHLTSARAVVLVAVLSALSLVTACGTASSGQTSDGKPRDGGDLSVVISGYSWSGLDPAGSPVTPVKGLLSLPYDSLLRLDANGSVVPWLVTSYEVSKDRLEWTLALREGVKFTDGSPFDAEAVKFNLLRQIDPDQHAGEGANLPRDLVVETPDPSTVVLKLKRPDESIAFALASTGVGLMASPTAVKKWGAEYGLHPVGTGPFKLEKQIVGQTARFVKNDDYWRDGEPHLNSVTYRVLGSGESALQTVTSGGAQMLDFVQPLQADAAKRFPELVLQKGDPTTVQQVWFNTTKPPFDDIRARRAVSYAIDPTALSEHLFYGFNRPVESGVGAGSWAYPGDEVPGYPRYDVQKAKQLVSELGDLSFKLTVTNTPEELATAGALQRQLAEAGITMKIVPEDITRLITDLFSRNFEGITAIVPGLPDPNNYVRPFYDSNVGPNPPGLKDPKLEALFDKAATTQGQDARKKVYAEVAERMAELAPSVYLSQNPPMKLHDKSLHGVEYLPIDLFYLNAAWLG